MVFIEDEEQDNTDDNDDEITDEIFKRFMRNAAKTRFKRTSPTEEPVLVHSTIDKCTKCGFKANDNGMLSEHIRNVHSRRSAPVHSGSPKQTITAPRKIKQYCHFWNNFRNCHFEENKPSFCSGSCDKIHAAKQLQNKTSLKDS